MNIAYRAARAQGAVTRSVYRRMIGRIVGRPVEQSRRVPVEVYSFSGERYLPEQVACARSFIRHVGVPDRFTIVSDGSYTQNSRELLRRVSDCVTVTDWDAFAARLPPYVRAFADRQAMGKKLAVLLSMPVKQATIYTDADILFFPAAGELVKLAQSGGGRFWYLPDCLPSLDDSILRGEAERERPVNAGFMLLKERLDWDAPLRRLAEYTGSPSWATEQTLVHLAMHQNDASPLSPDKFVLSVSDQFVYKDHYARQDIALRHYVNNVRHKFWQAIPFQGARN